mmetsp:Transcript_5946/g.15139  ORF Transcript_5946/g.15139 Transcript_5946/m.15139 type:complete len:518 (+) Transcript_5946:183-1736(+)
MGKKKGKSKKGKKSSKKKSAAGLGDPKTKVPTAEEKLWQKRYEISELSRNQHRANATALVTENQQLTDKLYTAEKDALEVITFFKKQRAEKEKEARDIGEQMRQLKRDYAQEKAAAEAATEKAMGALKKQLTEKEAELTELRMKLVELADWDASRGELVTQLEELRNDQEAAAMGYKKHIETMEIKFNEEKLRQRKETDAEIAALAASAHDAAVAELDKTTQQAFRDVARLTTELEINRRECDRLGAEVAALGDKTSLLESQKTEAEFLAKDAVARFKHRDEQATVLAQKVEALETTLGHCVREFENEHGLLAARTDERTSDLQVQLVAAHRALKLKTAENKRIRALARKVVQQRSETEQFFAEALGETRERILEQRAEFEKAMKTQYRHQMMAGAKTGVLPPIKTFGNHPESTNSHAAGYDAAGRLPDLAGQVSISDMTWEQKEEVLRLLFAKMNSPREPRAFTIEVVKQQAAATPAIEDRSGGRRAEVPDPRDAGDSAAFFITEGALEQAVGQAS